MISEELMREVKRLKFRTRRRVTDLFAGNYHSAFKGSGIEFAEVREYEPGDDVRSIDWHVTARTGRTFVKRFVEERQLTIILMVDLSGSGAFATAGKLKRAVAAELAAVLGFTAARNRDRVGMLLFAAEPDVFLPPASGRNHLLRALRELVAYEPANPGTNIAAASEFLGSVLRRRAVVFVVSDFLAPATGFGGWERELRLLNRRHEVVAIRVSDPRERNLPPLGLVNLRDPESGKVRLVDLTRRAARRYADEAFKRRVETEKAMARAGVDRIDVSTDAPFMPELLRYFRRRGTRR